MVRKSKRKDGSRAELCDFLNGMPAISSVATAQLGSTPGDSASASSRRKSVAAESSHIGPECIVTRLSPTPTPTPFGDSDSSRGLAAMPTTP